MLNYKSVSKCAMGIRDKVALIYIGLLIIIICNTFCMPKAKKILKRIKNGNCNSQSHKEKSKVENNIETICKKYNFPQTEFAVGVTPKKRFNLKDFDQNSPFYKAKNNNDALKTSPCKHFIAKKNKARKAFDNIRENLKKGAECSSTPNVKDLANFPDVEYPINAIEIWKPNYWNYFQPTDILQNNSFKTDTNTCKKCTRYKDKFSKSGKAVKGKSTSISSHNFTDDEICSNTTKSFTLTTSSPYSNFVMTDINSFPVLTQAPMEDKNQTSTTPMPKNNIVCKDNSVLNDYTESVKTPNIKNVISANSTDVPSGLCFDDKNTSIYMKNFDDNVANVGRDNDEEFTTDDPEYAYALSTPLPYAIVDIWKKSQVLDPYKSISDSDELDDYFIAVT